MRLLALFIIGFLSFFFIGDILRRIFKQKSYSIFGLTFIVVGFLIGFWGDNFISPPLDVLYAFFLIGSGLGLTIHHLLARRFIIHQKLETDFVRRHETKFERFLEMLPGLLMWTALTSPLWLAFLSPFALAYLIIIADVYWLLTAIKTAVFIFLGYKSLEKARSIEWLEKLKTDFSSEWQDYYQLIVIPVYKEELFILAPTFEAIKNSKYPKSKIFLAIGFEERTDPEKRKEIESFLKNYSKEIGGVFTTIHPYGLEGEVPGAGTNRNWMMKNAVKEFEKRRIDIGNVFVTTLDADFVIHPQFLAGALHKYLSTPQQVRNKRSYTGAFLYYNNYWQTPTPMRLIACGTAFWQLAEMVGSDKYQNFSSMSINMKTLLDIGLWIPNKVNDDSGFYWKAYFHFKGDYKVLPHFLPISADAVLDTNLWKTFQNQYLQLKRWAYGVEHIPFIFKQYFQRTDIDFWDKTDKLTFVLWGYLKWGFLALFVTFAGNLIQLVNPKYSQSVLSVNLPIISSWILTAAFLGIFATIYVHEKTAPKRPANWNLLNYFWSYIQWLLVPLVLISISTLPAIDAQTSLMLGKYMKEFRNTNKARLIT